LSKVITDLAKMWTKVMCHVFLAHGIGSLHGCIWTTRGDSCGTEQSAHRRHTCFRRV